MMVKKSDGELIAEALLQMNTSLKLIATALENISDSIDSHDNSVTDMNDVSRSLDDIATAIGGTLDVRLDGDIGVSKND